MQSRSKLWKTVLVISALALPVLARVHAAPADHQVPMPTDGGARDEQKPQPADDDKRASGPKQGTGGISGGGGVTGSGGGGGVSGGSGGSGGMSGSGGVGGGTGGAGRRRSVLGKRRCKHVAEEAHLT